MLVVKCSEEQFIYDIHSLVKAFYPAQDVKVFKEGDKTLTSSDGLPELFIFFEKTKITIELREENQNIKSETVLDAEKTELTKKKSRV